MIIPIKTINSNTTLKTQIIKLFGTISPRPPLARVPQRLPDSPVAPNNWIIEDLKALLFVFIKELECSTCLLTFHTNNWKCQRVCLLFVSVIGISNVSAHKNHWNFLRVCLLFIRIIGMLHVFTYFSYE